MLSLLCVSGAIPGARSLPGGAGAAPDKGGTAVGGSEGRRGVVVLPASLAGGCQGTCLYSPKIADSFGGCGSLAA